MKPIIFSFDNTKKLNQLIKKYKPTTNDNYEAFVKELFKINYPQIQNPSEKQLNTLKKSIGLGNWAFFPWNNTLVHIPSEEQMFKLKTARNKLLISKIEQDNLRKTTVAFLGLSTGSHASITWMMQSHANNIKIADFDTLDGSNLNRIRSGWNDIGFKKTDLTVQQIYQQNPYTNVFSFDGVTQDNVLKLIRNIPKVDVIVDLIDSLNMKIELRKLARKYKVPVIMTTDIGNNVKIEVERYDLEPNTSFFNNQLGNIEKINFNNLSKPEMTRLIIKLVGLKNNSSTMLDSLIGIGSKIPTWPQLGSTATIGGGVLTTLITKIVQKKSTPSGTYWINMDKLLDKNYNSIQTKTEVSLSKKAVKKLFNL